MSPQGGSQARTEPAEDVWAVRVEGPTVRRLRDRLSILRHVYEVDVELEALASGHYVIVARGSQADRDLARSYLTRVKAF